MSPKKIKPKPLKEPAANQQREVRKFEQVISSGPLPPPDDLNGYNQVIENGAERIMAMAERQSAHRITQESRVIKAGGRDSLLGIVSGLTISIGAFMVAGFALSLGHPGAATAICTVNLAALVGVFIYGTKNK